MRVTDEMVEAACDALDDACVAFHRDGHPNASVHWKGFMRADRIGVMRAALEAALSHAAGQEVDDSARLPVNHAEALELALIKRTSSNLARCYIDLASTAVARSEGE